MKITTKLSEELNNLQNNVIGLFKLSKLGDIWLVINNDDGHLECIRVTQLGAMSTLHINQEQGKLKMFGDGISLNDLKSDPFKLDRLFSEFLNN